MSSSRVKRSFFEGVEARVSCREFVPNAPLLPTERDAILKAACRAPSAGNLQAWKVYEVLPDQLAELSAAALDQEWITTAAMALVFFADPETSAAKYRKRGRNLYAVQDATIACTYAQLSCEFLGLGACWVGAFDEDEVRQIAGIEKDDLVPVALLIIGRPSAGARTKPRSRRRSSEVLIPKRHDAYMNE